MFKVFAIAALAVAVTQAAIFQWDGLTMNFNEPENWDGSVVPVNSSQLDMKSDVAYTTNIEPGTYSTKRLILPMNGRLVLKSNSGRVRIAFPSTTTAPAAKFLGPREDEKFNFGCAKNWRVKNSDDEFVPTSAIPCREDIVELTPSTNAYYFQTSAEATVFPVQRVRLDGGSHNSLSTLTSAAPQWQLSQVLDKFRFFQFDSECLYQDADGLCFCPNTCPTDEEREEQDSVIDGDANREAEVLIEEGNKMKTVTVNYTVAAPLLGGTASVMTSVVGLDQNTQDSLMDAAIVTFIRTSIPQSELMSITTTSSSIELVLNVTAKAGDIVGYGDFDKLESLGATRALSFSTVTIFDTEGSSKLDLTVESALKMFLVQAVVQAEQDDSSVDDAACTDVATCTGFLTAVADLASLFANPATLLSTLCPAGACQANAAVVTVLNAATKSVLAHGLSAAAMSGRVSGIASNIGGLDLSTGADKTFFDNVLAALTDAQDTTDDVSGTGPTVQKFEGVQVVAGQSLSRQSLLLLLNLDNRAAVTAAIQAAILSLPVMVSVDNVQLTLVEDTRRSVSDGMTAEFDYEALCGGDITKCDISQSAALREQIVAAMEAQFRLVDVEVPTCYDLEDEWDVECLTRETQQWLDEQEDPSSADFEAYLRNLVGCDIQGRDESGNCIRSNDQAGELVSTAGASVDASKNEKSKNNGSSSGPPIGIIAGCVAAVVIIAIVALVAVKRNKRNPASAIKDERNAVAFNNPLYDDTDNVMNETVQNPVYDDMMDDDNAGLYDEPANNVTAAMPEATYEAPPDDDDDDAGYFNPDGETGYLDVEGNEEGVGGAFGEEEGDFGGFEDEADE